LDGEERELEIREIGENFHDHAKSNSGAGGNQENVQK